MSERVSEILSCYNGENPGVLTNLARMLGHGTLAGTGKLVILPVDQGIEHGPARSFASNAVGYDPGQLRRSATNSQRPFAARKIARDFFSERSQRKTQASGWTRACITSENDTPLYLAPRPLPPGKMC